MEDSRKVAIDDANGISAEGDTTYHPSPSPGSLRIIQSLLPRGRSVKSTLT